MPEPDSRETNSRGRLIDHYRIILEPRIFSGHAGRFYEAQGIIRLSSVRPDLAFSALKHVRDLTGYN